MNLQGLTIQSRFFHTPEQSTPALPAHQLDPLIIAVEIKKLSPHPQSSKLQCCEVFDGQHSWQVVCGASNVQLGMKTILAKPGATLPNQQVIQTTELRGVNSQGMLCSPAELGIQQEKGIVHLPGHITPGMKAAEIDPMLLSSTPWFEKKAVEAFYWSEEQRRFLTRRYSDLLQSEVVDPKLQQCSDAVITSITYFDGQQYSYRNF